MIVQNILIPIRQLISDPQGQRWDDTTIISLIDECQKFICRKVDMLYSKDYITVPAVSNSFILPSTCNKVHRARNINSRKGLVFTTEEEMDESGYWEDVSGDITHLVINNQDKRHLTVYPISSIDTTLLVGYSVIPNTLVSVNDVISIPDEYISIFKYYVSAQLFMFDMDSLNRQFGNEQFQLFNAELINIQHDYSISNNNRDRQTKQRKF